MADKMKLTTCVPLTFEEGQLIMPQFVTDVKVSGIFTRHLNAQIVGVHSLNFALRLQVIAEILFIHGASFSSFTRLIYSRKKGVRDMDPAVLSMIGPARYSSQSRKDGDMTTVE